MPSNLVSKETIKTLAAKAAGLDKPDGNPRVRQIVNRVLVDLMVAIDELDISMDEFWAGVAYLQQSGQANEMGLLAPGMALSISSISASTRRSAAPASTAALSAPSKARSTSRALH